jgi:predicted nucleic acid-binding Zn ribbon protein
VKRLPRCLHCGGIMPINRNRFCSHFCEFEDKHDRRANKQRIDTFQALADAQSWLRIKNATIASFSDPCRRLVLFDKKQFSLGGTIFMSYRLNSAGYRLLARWKASMEVSV